MGTTLLIIFGPAAVGKMTVAQEVCKRTGFKLFHNHMTIDPIRGIFDFGSAPFGRIITEFRFRVMEEAVQAGIPLVHTFMWAFPIDNEFVARLKTMVESYDGRILFVELQASQEIRRQRTRTENRRKHKPHNAHSDQKLSDIDSAWCFDSTGRFPYPDDHLRIENDEIPAEKAARMICEHFGLRKANDDAVL